MKNKTKQRPVQQLVPADKRRSRCLPVAGQRPVPAEKALAELREIVLRTQIEAARYMEEYYAKGLTHLAAANRGKSSTLRALLKDFDRIYPASAFGGNARMSDGASNQ